MKSIGGVRALLLIGIVDLTILKGILKFTFSRLVSGTRFMATPGLLLRTRRCQYIPFSALGCHFTLRCKHWLHFNPNPSLSTTQTQNELVFEMEIFIYSNSVTSNVVAYT